jgi:hypothetical protein
MDRRAGIVVPLRGRGLLMAGAMLLAGCTMCPDPYDYSGPVPNGSAPQNDFRARSNGILPLGAAPVPWPQVVRDGVPGANGRRLVRRHGTPTPADETVLAVSAETPVEQREPTSVLVAAGSEPAEAGEDPRRDPWQVLPDFDALDASTPAEHDADVPEALPDEPAVSTPAVVVAPLAETPGWRPRGSR